MGRDSIERRSVHAKPVSPARVSRHDAGGCLFCEVRQGNDDTERHQHGHCQRGRRFCSAEASRVCGSPDPADGRTDRDLRRIVMAQFTANPQRFDPYNNFKFRVKWDNKYVAGVSKCGMLKRTTEVVKHREGGDPSSSRKSPGRTEYDAITLERGVTHDLEFEK